MAEITNFELISPSKVMLVTNGQYNFFHTPLTLTREMIDNGLWVLGEVAIYAGVAIYGDDPLHENKLIEGVVYSTDALIQPKNLFELLNFSEFFASGAIDNELLDSGYYKLGPSSTIDDSCWIDGDMYYYSNHNKEIIKVEVSLDGGLTYGVIYDATDDQVIYKLIPNNNSGEEYTDNWIVDYTGLWEDTNQDITFPIEWTLYRNDEPVATGTSYVGPFSCPAYESTNTGVGGNLYADYNGETYSTGLYLNITNSYIEPRLTVYYGSNSTTATKSNPYKSLRVDDVYSGGHMYNQSFSGTYDYISNDYNVYGEYWSASTTIDNFPVLEGCSENQTLGEVSCNGLNVSIIADCYDY